jgi:hypothetical protein
MSFKPIDQNQEHINLQIATSFRNYKNSTHDENIVLNRLSLTANVVGICRSNIEKAFGQVIDGKHSHADLTSDTLLLTRHLFNERRVRSRSNADMALLTKPLFESLDILSIGMSKLMDAVPRFNQEFIVPVDMPLEARELLLDREDGDDVVAEAILNGYFESDDEYALDN